VIKNNLFYYIKHGFVRLKKHKEKQRRKSQIIIFGFLALINEKIGMG
jgi:hypothetical protein